MADKRAAKPGEVIAWSGSSELIFTRTDKDGLDWGYIRDGFGESYDELPLVSILVRGYWQAVPPK